METASLSSLSGLVRRCRFKTLCAAFASAIDVEDELSDQRCELDSNTIIAIAALTTIEENGNPKNGPDVTFIVAAQNVAPFVEDAVRSALSQTDVQVEVIVVDDASSDTTATIVERLAASDSRVILIRHERALGPGGARNTAMARARGAWMAILDGDDLIEPCRSRRLINLAAATSADLVGDNFERITVDGRPTGITMRPRAERPYSLIVKTADFIEGNIAFSTRRLRNLGAIKVMFRTEFMRLNSLMHKEDIPIGEDYHLILSSLLRGGRFVVSAETFYKYRQRASSQSWRLTEDHVERMLRAHQATLNELGELGARTTAAAAEYGRALERTRDMTRVVSLAKRGKWRRALIKAARTPQAWPLVCRMGGQAVLNRLLPRRGGVWP